MKSQPLVRWFGPLVGWALVCCSLYPAWLPSSEDSFPLSTYPMFSKERVRATVYQLVAVDERGRTRPVPPQWLGTEELLQAKVLIRNAATGGARRRARFCRKVAQRVAGSPEAAGIVELALMRVTLKPIEYLEKGAETARRTRLGSCLVLASSEQET